MSSLCKGSGKLPPPISSLLQASFFEPKETIPMREAHQVAFVGTHNCARTPSTFEKVFATLSGLKYIIVFLITFPSQLNLPSELALYLILRGCLQVF